MRIIFLLTFICLFQFSNLSAQNFNLVDSIQLNLASFQERESFSKMNIRLLHDELYLHEAFDTSVVKYDLKGSVLDTVFLERVLPSREFSFWFLEIEETMIVAVDVNRYKIRTYDMKGNFMQEVNISNSFSSYYPNLNANFSIDLKKELIYTELIPKKHPKYFYKIPSKPGKFYQKSNLIGVYNFEGKLIQTFGTYDSMYFQGDLPYKDDFSFKRVGDELILEQDLAHQVNVFKLNNLTPSSYNFKGDAIAQKSDALPRVKEVLNEESYHGMLIESYGYGAFLAFNSSQLVGRVYYKSAEDTSTSVVTENTKKRVKPVKGSCLTPSDQKLNQKAILADKVMYIRMVDWNTKKVVYDGGFTLKGDFFFTGASIPENQIWTKGYKDGVLTIYKYELN